MGCRHRLDGGRSVLCGMHAEGEGVRGLVSLGFDHVKEALTIADWTTSVEALHWVDRSRGRAAVAAEVDRVSLSRWRRR